MIFWDSSALVALLVDEPESSARIALLEGDPDMSVWWATPVECESALQRRLREGSLTPADARPARDRLAVLAASWHEVNPTGTLRKLAQRLLRPPPGRGSRSGRAYHPTTRAMTTASSRTELHIVNIARASLDGPGKIPARPCKTTAPV